MFCQRCGTAVADPGVACPHCAAPAGHTIPAPTIADRMRVASKDAMAAFRRFVANSLAGLRESRRSKICIALFLVLAACSGSTGGYSGRYEGDMMGGKVWVDFQGGAKCKVTLVSPDGKDSMSHNCVYVLADGKMTITTDEPMGVPMHLVVDGATLTDGSGLVLKKK
jgi:hypothetical protein